MYKCLKLPQENLNKRIENWKQLSIKFETKKYNTKFIADKMFGIEMNNTGFFRHHFFYLIL